MNISEKHLILKFKNKKKTFLSEVSAKIQKQGSLLRKRNKDGKHVNYKIHYLLHDPFIFVNAYAKISKNKEALTKSHEDESVIKLSDLQTAVQIAQKIKNS